MASSTSTNQTNKPTSGRGRGNGGKRGGRGESKASSSSTTTPSSSKSTNETERGRGGGSTRGGKNRGRGNHQNNQSNSNKPPSSRGGKTLSVSASEFTPPSVAITTSSSSSSTTSSSSSSSSSSSQSVVLGDYSTCLICLEVPLFWSLGACNHRSLCIKCSLRYRACYQDMSCPLCKQDLPIVVAVSLHDSRNFEEFVLKKGSLPFEKGGSMFLSAPEAEQTVFALLHTFNCPICKSSLSNLGELKKHLNQTHSMTYCDVCLQHRKVFLPDQSVYPLGKGLKMHMKHGDKNDPEAPRGHTLCKFCSKYFYGIDEHYEHMTDAHEECQMCRMHGKLYQFFADYTSLENHFDTEHFLCKEQRCLNDRYVVFATDNELKAHNVAFHLGNKKLSRREERAALQLQLDLTYGSSSSSSSSSSSLSNAERERLRYEQEQQEEQLRMLQMAEMEKERKIRNDEVVAKMIALIGEQKYIHFKGSSKLFLQGSISATDFYDMFIRTFGAANASSLFEGVVDLLPPQFASRAQALRTAKARADQRVSEFPSLSSLHSAPPRLSSSNLSYLTSVRGPGVIPSSSSPAPPTRFGTTAPTFAATASRSNRPKPTSNPPVPKKSAPPPVEAFPTLSPTTTSSTAAPTWGPSKSSSSSSTTPTPKPKKGKRKGGSQNHPATGFTIIEPVLPSGKPSTIAPPPGVDFHQCFTETIPISQKPPASTTTTTKRKSKRGETILTWG